MKKYLKELKTNPYWEVEPHFYYQSLWETIGHLQTARDNSMTSDDLQSALYGEFVIKGKPIPKGFIKSFNSMIRFIDKIINDSQFKAQTSKPKHLNSIHSCIQHSKMVKKTKCIHKLTLPLYARGEKWISSKKVTGEMIYICTKCGAILDRGFIERDANVSKGGEE